MADYILHRLGPFDIPGLRTRHVRVYVPPRDRNVASPVLYAFDGQNLFDDEPAFAGGWHLHKTAWSLSRRRRVAPVIVGIDHGAEERIHELAPWASDKGGGRTDQLLDWIIAHLMPRVRTEFNLASEPANVGIGGSSLGGLAALYAHFRNPEQFGVVLAMSPSLWVGRGKLFEFIASKAKPWTSRIYLDAGALEAGGSVLSQAQRLAGDLRGRGWDDQSLRMVAAKRGTHSEKHWRRRAPSALEFLFPSPLRPKSKRK